MTSRRQGRGGTVVGYLVEELVVIAAVVIVFVIVAAKGRCPGGGHGGPASNLGVVGQQQRLF